MGRLIVSANDKWGFVPDDYLSPYVNVELELHSNYAQVVISKETVPSFLFLAKKVCVCSSSSSLSLVKAYGDDV